jgi:hypothetical protein
MGDPVDQPGADQDGTSKWDDWYWKQAERVQEDISSGADSFDKSMLTLSSGALGVSLAVIKDIVPLGQATCIFLLLLSWVAFASCIVITVVSFLFSIAAQKQHRDLLDRMYTQKDPNLAKTAPAGWNKAVWVCTRIALILFLVGLVCTMIFIVVNVSRDHADHDTKKSDAPAITNIRNFYMSDQGQSVEKVVKPQGAEKGRQPMKLVPPPPPPPAPCPSKE